MNASSWSRLRKRQVQEGHYSFSRLFSLEMGLKSLKRGALCKPQRREQPYFQRQRDTKKNPREQAWLSFNQFTTLICPVWPPLLDGKESVCIVGDLVLIPGSGRSPGEGNGKRLQYSCLENSMDRGVWQAAVHGVTKRNTTGWLILWLSFLHVCPLLNKPIREALRSDCFSTSSSPCEGFHVMHKCEKWNISCHISKQGCRSHQWLQTSDVNWWALRTLQKERISII